MQDNQENARKGAQSHPNRLIYDKSPYLLQHAWNPVDWYPWGDAAFQKAKEEDRPIFLSIGYATCHWCHVMAHESFEDEEVARLLNTNYVSIKVDREERPDVDQVYMTVCQALTGHGGWPLSVFLTPDGKPFFSGTYFPKSGRMGMPGFMDILKQIAVVWCNDRARVLKASEEITTAIQPKAQGTAQSPLLDLGALRKAYGQFLQSFDSQWGGFGSAPKFPIPHHFSFLLRWHRRSHDPSCQDMVEKTLDAMRTGGIFDQIGFGFHRYSVDERWLVPHFEKMLYDQALLAMAYTEAYQAMGKERFSQAARDIFTYVLRDMTAPEGGFFSAEDADSEGKEGLFYVWKPREVKEHLGEDLGALFCRFYDITPYGNFEEGHSIPHIPVPPRLFAEREGLALAELETRLEDARQRLFHVREGRVHPLKDDKILTSWNGLMIAALAKGYKALGHAPYVDAAKRAAAFILARLRTPEGRLYRRYREGEVSYPGYLDDYAFLIWGLIELYEATFDASYLEQAAALNTVMMELFWDEASGGLYFSGTDNEALIAQSKEVYDGALPSGNSVAALNMVRLARMTGSIDLEKKADQLVKAFSAQITAHPMAYTQFLNAVDFMLGPSREIVIAGNRSLETTRAMISLVHKLFLPNAVTLLRDGGTDDTRLLALAPFAAHLGPAGNLPVVYVCEQYACKAPITDLAGLASALQ